MINKYFTLFFCLATIPCLYASLEMLLADMALWQATESQGYIRSLSVVAGMISTSLKEELYTNKSMLTSPIGWISYAEIGVCYGTFSDAIKNGTNRRLRSHLTWLFQQHTVTWGILVSENFHLNLTFLEFNLEYSLYKCNRESLVMSYRNITFCGRR